NPIPIDTATNDTAALHNASANAGGTVDYRYYSSLANCQADASAFPTAQARRAEDGSGTVTNGSVPPSAPVTFHNAGTVYWAAFYSGDANNKPAVSDCTTELLVVNPASPTITTDLAVNSILEGGSTNDTATLHNASANAGGTVDYRYYSSLANCQADASAFP